MLDDREQLETPSSVGGDAVASDELGTESAPQIAENGRLGGPAKPKRNARRSVVVAVAALVALGAGTYFGASWWTTGRYMVSTDDAYVGARNSTLSPKVSGYVSDVAVEDNAHVKAGEVIVRIDDGDYRLAAQTARDQ